MLHQKLKSNRGASLALALFLFIILTVLGASVLTAATAAAGRVSKMAEMDRRYYNVSSAAQLLSDKLDRKTVKVTRSEQKTVKTTARESGDGSAPVSLEVVTRTEYGTAFTDEPQEDDYVLRTFKLTHVPGAVDIPTSDPEDSVYPTDKDLSFLTEATAYLLFGGSEEDECGECSTKDAFSAPIPAPGCEYFSKSFTMSLALSGSESITVNVDATLRSDGSLRLILSDRGDDSDDYYALQMILTPKVSDGAPVSSGAQETQSVADDTDPSITYVTTTMPLRTRTTTIRWNVTSVEKVMLQEVNNG